MPVQGQHALSNQQVDYEELYQAHRARVLRLCQLLLGDVDEAQEVSQEVFLKLFAAIGALIGFGSGLEVVLHRFFIATFLAVVVLLYQGRLLKMLANVGTILTNPLRSKAKKKPAGASTLTAFRMGPAIFLATGLELALQWPGR